MRVDVYHINQATDEPGVEVLDAELVDVLGDYPEDAPAIEAEIAQKGRAFIGGGAQPLFKVVAHVNHIDTGAIHS